MKSPTSYNQVVVFFYRFRRVIFSILLLSFYSLSPTTASANELKFYATDYPPYDIKQHPDGLKGYDVDIVEAVLKQAKIDATVSFLPWKRIMAMLASGQATGAVTCGKSPGRESFAYLSDPISQARVAIVTSSDFEGMLQSIQDLHGLKVIAVTDWVTERELTAANVDHGTVRSLEIGLNTLAHREVDAFYVGWESAQYLAQVLGYREKFSYHQVTDKEPVPFHVCFSKLWPGHQNLAKRFNTALAQIRASGLYDRIRAKYE
ncbi:substrate-binding periplasmic protein [Kiloniella sp.]|uniref:substrate-binding periplasmic protein n=1 Tax=Kiloniella sp. TaxID=1938587 RepID=UPI003B026712